jgi:hypothetical protein
MPGNLRRVLIKKRPPPLEKIEERLIIKLYEQVGLIVIKFSQAQKAQQTAGIADLLVLDTKRESSWWHEVKRRQGPEYQKVQYGQTLEQRIFQQNVESVGHTYILGPLTRATSYLEEVGIIRGVSPESDRPLG